MTSNRMFGKWNEIFRDVVIVTAILDQILHHSTMVNIKGSSCPLNKKAKLIREPELGAEKRGGKYSITEGGQCSRLLVL